MWYFNDPGKKMLRSAFQLDVELISFKVYVNFKNIHQKMKNIHQLTHEISNHLTSNLIPKLTDSKHWPWSTYDVPEQQFNYQNRLKVMWSYCNSEVLHVNISLISTNNMASIIICKCTTPLCKYLSSVPLPLAQSLLEN